MLVLSQHSDGKQANIYWVKGPRGNKTGYECLYMEANNILASFVNHRSRDFYFLPRASGQRCGQRSSSYTLITDYERAVGDFISFDTLPWQRRRWWRKTDASVAASPLTTTTARTASHNTARLCEEDDLHAVKTTNSVLLCWNYNREID